MSEILEVNAALTRRVAHLARLELSETEVETFTRQLGDVFKYVEVLQGVSIPPGLEPVTHPFPIDTPLREDTPRSSPVDSEGQPKTLRDAPEVLDGGFKVPSIL